MACARNLKTLIISFELIDGKFVGFLIIVQNQFQTICFTLSPPVAIPFFPKKSAFRMLNKTLYRALTRWGYTNTHITVQ